MALGRRVFALILMITLPLLLAVVIGSLIDAFSVTLASPSPEVGGTGMLNVEHRPIILTRLAVTGGGSIASDYIDYVEVVAYVKNSDDAGYYNVTIVLYIEGVAGYIANGIVYIGTTPVTMYFTVPPTPQSGDTYVVAFARWMG